MPVIRFRGNVFGLRFFLLLSDSDLTGCISERLRILSTSHGGRQEGAGQNKSDKLPRSHEGDLGPQSVCDGVLEP